MFSSLIADQSILLTSTRQSATRYLKHLRNWQQNVGDATNLCNAPLLRGLRPSASVHALFRLSICLSVCLSVPLSLWRASFTFCHSLPVCVSPYASLALPLALFVVCALCVRTFNCNWILITALSAKNVAVARLADRADRADSWTDEQAERDRQTERGGTAGSNWQQQLTTATVAAAIGNWRLTPAASALLLCFSQSDSLSPSLSCLLLSPSASTVSVSVSFSFFFRRRSN